MPRHTSKLSTLFLAVLCIGLVVGAAVLFVRIAQLTHAMAAVSYSPYVVVVTPTLPPMTATGTVTVTPTPTDTPTPTATWTPVPTRTPRPTKTATPTITPTSLPRTRPTAVTIDVMPTQNISSTYVIPTAVPRYPISEEALVVVLLGSDRRPDWEHWNTDAMQVVVVYPKIPSVTVLSIPRDLYVYLPTLIPGRINLADMYGDVYDFEGGGFGLLNQTMLWNLGITADYYAKVNFQGLKDIVDSLGGIDVPVHCHLQDYWPYPDENGEFHIIALEPGVQHMDGKLALWYSRTRKTTSVFDREARQQQVLEAIWQKAKSGGLLEAIPTLYQQYGQSVETDLPWGDLLMLGALAARIEPSQLTFYNIGRTQVQPYVTWQGGSVFLPVWDEMSQVIDRAMLPPSSSRAAHNSIRVEIWNGTGQPNWDMLATDTLNRNGFVAFTGSPDGQRYPQTLLQVFGEHAKGTGAAEVQALFDIPDTNVTYVGATEGDVRLRLILGEAYDPCQ